MLRGVADRLTGSSNAMLISEPLSSDPYFLYCRRFWVIVRRVPSHVILMHNAPCPHTESVVEDLF